MPQKGENAACRRDEQSVPPQLQARGGRSRRAPRGSEGGGDPRGAARVLDAEVNRMQMCKHPEPGRRGAS
eukprot:scaffold66327_cov58-Phaeocystis_antarctica.AAC.2